ncbi:MAG: glutamate racemase [Waddliaceae bacterium]
MIPVGLGGLTVMKQAIGIFDSGLGGLTVMKQAIKVLPNENFIYFGDTARVPYGDKSPETIIRYSFENAAFLLSHNIKLLLVACNTASAYAIKDLQQQFSLPIVDVIEPAVQQAVQITDNRRIAILGTRATINSGIYQKRIQEKLPFAEVFSIACPLLVPLVEENFHSHPATRMIIQEYLTPLKKQGVDTVILGCTHYPLLLELIREKLRDVTLLDSASACANAVVEQLEKEKLTTNLITEGKRKYYVSDSPERFRQVGENFLGIPIEKVERRTL